MRLWFERFQESRPSIQSPPDYRYYPYKLDCRETCLSMANGYRHQLPVALHNCTSIRSAGRLDDYLRELHGFAIMLLVGIRLYNEQSIIC